MTTTYNPEDVTAAIMGKLNTILGAGGLSSNAFISVVDGGLLVEPSDLDFLTDAPSSGGAGGGGGNPFGGSGDADSGGNNPFGPKHSHSTGGSTTNPKTLDHHQMISHLMNNIPSPGKAWAAGLNTVDELYDQWLKLAQVPIIQLTSEQKNELKQARKTILKGGRNYFKYKIQYQAASSQVQSAELSGADTIKISQLKEAEETALQAWQTLGSKEAFESAVAMRNQLAAQGYVEIKQEMSDAYKNTKNNTLDGQGNHYLPVNLIPDSFIESDEVWNDFYFTSQEISEYKSTEQDKWSGSATIPLEDLFWVGGGASGSDKTFVHDLKIDNFSISFKFARVVIDRQSWFEPAMIESRAWWWQGATPAKPDIGPYTFSDGQPPLKNEGLWVLTPTEVLFVKDLTIDVNTSDNYTKTTMDHFQEHVDVGFLFFHLGGEDVDYTKNTYTHKFTSKDGKITAPSMQIQAFICDVMPQEPNPETSLMPSS